MRRIKQPSKGSSRLVRLVNQWAGAQFTNSKDVPFYRACPKGPAGNHDDEVLCWLEQYLELLEDGILSVEPLPWNELDPMMALSLNGSKPPNVVGPSTSPTPFRCVSHFSFVPAIPSVPARPASLLRVPHVHACACVPVLLRWGMSVVLTGPCFARYDDAGNPYSFLPNLKGSQGSGV